ncbi:protein HIT1 [Podospora fimiseda]|uniref:Protein HIT1 n=1 Tax=Podospora fimiseda TaxID=252190 RepID=A0AAN7BRN6_9PEZI|nr:protein HIT1 [Podospora fimiseda]
MSSPPREESARSAPTDENGNIELGLEATLAEPRITTERPPVPELQPENKTVDSPPKQRPEPKLCGVCQAQPVKYKCPRPGCLMPYCSAACNKTHKENHPPDPIIPPPQPTKTHTEPPQEDDPYNVLVEHKHVFDRLFKRYPNLAAALDKVQASTLPPSLSEQFAPRKNGRPNNVPWTKDVGLRKGAEALKKARTDPTDTGDGVREFCDVVLYLLSTNSKREKAMDMVREEVEREERDVIARLLKEEIEGDSAR